MKGGELLAEGGYGCIFYPAVTCSGTTDDDKSVISKIQLNNDNSINEYQIGQLIVEKIPNYTSFFAPAISKCDLLSKKIKDGNDCSFIKKKKNNLILMKMPYTHGEELGDFIRETKNIKKVILCFIDCYKHLLMAISHLQKNKICHFDIKSHNIIFNIKKNIPILIDFGLSIDIEQMNERLKFFFYKYVPEYYVWPLEVHILNYILKYPNRPLNIKVICNSFVKNNKAIQQVFSKKIISLYNDLCIDYSKKYSSMSHKNIIKDILSHWSTWDNYSLSILFLKQIAYFNKNGAENNPFIIQFSQLLFENIDPDPNQRNTLSTTIDKFNSFFFDTKINKTSNYEKLFTQLDTSYTLIQNAILKNHKDMVKLKTKTIRN